MNVETCKPNDIVGKLPPPLDNFTVDPRPWFVKASLSVAPLAPAARGAADATSPAVAEKRRASRRES